jgi:hypothetical protein
LSMSIASSWQINKTYRYSEDLRQAQHAHEQLRREIKTRFML